MTKWFTSDLHLGHHNIITFCERPYDSVEHMNADIVARWNSVVAADDEVWILGDLAMGRINDSLALVGKLNGRIFLVPGNHDRMFDTGGTKYANEVKRYTDAGIDKIVDTCAQRFAVTVLSVDLNDDLVANVSHFPYRGDHLNEHEDRYQDFRPTNNGFPLIHGHTHGHWRKLGKMVDVGVDAWGGFPVSWETVAETLSLSEDLERIRWEATW